MLDAALFSSLFSFFFPSTYIRFLIETWCCDERNIHRRAKKIWNFCTICSRCCNIFFFQFRNVATLQLYTLTRFNKEINSTQKPNNWIIWCGSIFKINFMFGDVFISKKNYSFSVHHQNPKSKKKKEEKKNNETKPTSTPSFSLYYLALKKRNIHTYRHTQQFLISSTNYEQQHKCLNWFWTRQQRASITFSPCFFYCVCRIKRVEITSSDWFLRFLQ